MINRWRKFVESFRLNILAAPNNIRLAIQSAWRGRERGLAIFAGVFLASLVMTTVLGYAVGLNQTFFQASLGNDVFDAKIDFFKKIQQEIGKVELMIHLFGNHSVMISMIEKNSQIAVLFLGVREYVFQDFLILILLILSL